ncbi:hypothetical protein [Desulfogranum japonicum]|uniref:hypothetical protein n=1 Tax=Desulfogranum japonicum TaxID=231447 RepID=UPI0004150043|nr:hypothetical protein [Desulfogranum japonicum]
MKTKKMSRNLILILLILLLPAFALPSLADKPSWAGNKEKSSKNNGKKKDHGSGHSNKGGGVTLKSYFNDRQRQVVLKYYITQSHSGHCPPGLAKKNNGCMPPGQAKKWQIGYPLPHDVVYYDLPPALVVQLGNPPQGHRYIRVASDILLITVGTAMIVDAIQDLGSM